MNNAIYQETVTLDEEVYSYDELINKFSLSAVSAKLASKYIQEYPEPQRAAKHLLRTVSFQTFGCIAPDFLPNSEDLDDLQYTYGLMVIICQLSMCLAIARLAGFNITDDDTWLFILGNFHDISISTFSSEEFSERIGYALAHGVGNIASSKAVGRRAYKYFFENKRNSKRYSKFL